MEFMYDIIAKASENQGSSLLEPDNYPAVCVQIISLGNQYNETFGNWSEKVRIVWELPDERGEYTKDGEKVEFARTIGKEYTNSLGAKANLRKDLESWRGKPFTEEELAGFGLSKLIGVPCLLQINNDVSKTGKNYNKIAAVTKLPKGMMFEHQPETEQMLFTFANPAWRVQMASLPEFVQEKIKTSKEYAEAENGTEVDTSSMAVIDDTSGDLPF